MLPRLLFLAAAATMCVAGVQATQCGWGTFDMSSYAEKDITYTDGGDFTYSMRACGVLSTDSPCTPRSSTASVCQTQLHPGQGMSSVTGNYVTPLPWRYLDPSDDSAGIGYTLQGETSCFVQGHAMPFYANVNFVCAIKTGPPTVNTQGGACTMNFTIPTPLACSGTPPPPPPETCQWNGYDMRSLVEDVLVGSDGGEDNTYQLQVCGSLPESSRLCPGGSACRASVDASRSLVVGSWTGKPEWKYIDPSVTKRGIMYTMYGAQSCWETGPPTQYQANINFECASQAGPLTVANMPYPGCVTNWTIPTPLACAPTKVHETELLALF